MLLDYKIKITNDKQEVDDDLGICVLNLQII